MELFNKSCSSDLPLNHPCVCITKILTVEITCKLLNKILIGTIDVYYFMLLSVALNLADHKISRKQSLLIPF